MNIIALETQNGGRDWPLIVMAIVCPVCNAPMGERCRTVRVENAQTNHLIRVGLERADWHAERKYAAANFWYAQKEAAQKLPSAEDLDADAEEKKIAEATANPPEPAPAPEGPRTKKGSVKKS